MTILTNFLRHGDRARRDSNDRHNNAKGEGDTLRPHASYSSVGSRSGNSDSSRTNPPYKLTIELESPPVTLYGEPCDSTGFILSGLLLLEVDAAQKEVDLDTVTLSLVQNIKYTKPFILPSSAASNCKNCTKKQNVLARWDVVTSETKFLSGKHAYPFSHLVPGSLPATTRLGSSQSGSWIKYQIVATATTPKRTGIPNKEVILPINISRSILRGPDRNSLRIFPTTDITAKAVLPHVVYPKSMFAIEFTLDNLVNKKGDRRWRMRKANWRIEECVKIRANTCEKHRPKLVALENSERKLRNSNKKTQASHSKPVQHHSTITTSLALSTYPGFSSMNVNENPASIENQSSMGDSEDAIVGDSEADIDERCEQNGDTQNESLDPLEQLITGTNSIQVTPSLTTQRNPAFDERKEDIYLEEVRTVSNGEMRSGWKSDFSSSGRVELVAQINASLFSTGSTNNVSKISSDSRPLDDSIHPGSNVSCDIDDPNLGVFVDHTLIFEFVVIEEAVPSTVSIVTVPSNSSDRGRFGKYSESPSIRPVDSHASSFSNQSREIHTKLGTLTGVARVFRMQFKLKLTERSGLGIAWDSEVPPTYNLVSALSPPNYSEASSGQNTPLVIPRLNSMPTPSPSFHPNDLESLRTPEVIEGIVEGDPLTSVPNQDSFTGLGPARSETNRNQ